MLSGLAACYTIEAPAEMTRERAKEVIADYLGARNPVVTMLAELRLAHESGTPRPAVFVTDTYVEWARIEPISSVRPGSAGANHVAASELDLLGHGFLGAPHTVQLGRTKAVLMPGRGAGLRQVDVLEKDGSRIHFDYRVHFDRLHFASVGTFAFQYHWVNALTPFCLFLIGPVALQLDDTAGRLPFPISLEYGRETLPLLFAPLWISGAPLFVKSRAERFCEALMVMQQHRGR